ncbi:unnamed protein product [Calicophoron daubneyi]|uniref:Uncharacterized protein n=1 Tax=Calicophoron daubneyi TaxID=300641 RepID=A0AAV2TCH7_CALDB
MLSAVWLLLYLRLSHANSGPSPKFSRKYWLDVVVSNVTEEISPMLGLIYPDDGQDNLLIFRRRRKEELYECYSCAECDVDSSQKTMTETGCRECAIVIQLPDKPRRLCNREQKSICRREHNARCCRMNLCNSATTYLSHTNTLFLQVAGVIALNALLT